MILPGATLGILGGGQLGRLFVVAARTMGYAVVVLDPDRDCPAAQLADKHIHAGYTDHYALERLAQECAAITTEFENVPASALDYLAGARPVRPSGAALAITQDRIREKNFLQSNGFDTAKIIPLYAYMNRIKFEDADIARIEAAANKFKKGDNEDLCYYFKMLSSTPLMSLNLYRTSSCRLMGMPTVMLQNNCCSCFMVVQLYCLMMLCTSFILV